MKRMLINATQPEELRVAMVDGQYLYDLDIEIPSHGQKKASVFKGKVTRIEPSLEAAFIDYGAERHGFLPFKDLSREYFADKQNSNGGRITISDALKEGQELIVQVEKEERGNKGAALTTFPSLAGRYLVLMPNNPRAGGISRRVEGDERNELREVLSALDVPSGMGLIVRTAGVGKSAEELQWDLDYLLKLWDAIEKAAQERAAPFLIYQESNVIIRALRDYYSQDVSEILIDSQETYGQARDFMQQVMPESLAKVKLYENDVPLFSRYQIESQIESAFEHTVRLPAGGSVVIDHTEAMVSIDINSARATKGSDIEETALSTNLEAADEIARQLRLRDLGGLLVIDFIDMTPARNQREVENRLREALKRDRARVQVGRISRFGLLEMSRQRLRPSLGESSLKTCPICTGRGRIRGPESLALSILRIVEEEAMKEKTGKIVARVSLEVGTFLLNEKRQILYDIETRHDVTIILLPDPGVNAADYEVHRVRDDDEAHESNRLASHELTESKESLPEFVSSSSHRAVDEPAVKAIAPTAPAPAPTPAVTTKTGPGVIARISTWLFGEKEDSSDDAQAARKNTRGNRQSRPNNNNNNERRRGNTRKQQPSGQRRDGRGGDARSRSNSNRGKQDTAQGEAAKQQPRGEQNQGRRGQSNDNRAKPEQGRRQTADNAARGRGRGDPGEQEQRTDSANANAVNDTAENKGEGKPEAKTENAPSTPTRSRRGRRGGRGRGRGGDANRENQDKQSATTGANAAGSETAQSSENGRNAPAQRGAGANARSEQGRPSPSEQQSSSASAAPPETGGGGRQPATGTAKQVDEPRPQAARPAPTGNDSASSRHLSDNSPSAPVASTKSDSSSQRTPTPEIASTAAKASSPREQPMQSGSAAQPDVSTTQTRAPSRTASDGPATAKTTPPASGPAPKPAESAAPRQPKTASRPHASASDATQEPKTPAPSATRRPKAPEPAAPSQPKAPAPSKAGEGISGQGVSGPGTSAHGTSGPGKSEQSRSEGRPGQATTPAPSVAPPIKTATETATPAKTPAPCKPARAKTTAAQGNQQVDAVASSSRSHSSSNGDES